MSRRKLKLIVGGAIVAAAIFFLLYQGFRDTLVYFVTPSELKLKGASAVGENFRLGGMVAEGSLVRGGDMLDISFRVTDGRETVPVVYRGVPPDLFKEGRGVVVEGRYTSDGIFKAATILAKHSEEYRAPRGPDMGAFKTLIFEDGNK